MATKKEIMGNEMVDALNKGFKELHLPFKAKTAPDFRDPQKIKEVQIRSEIPHTSAVFVFEHKTNVSAAENLWNFSEQLHKEWQEQKSIDMRNVNLYGEYLYQSVDASGLYANGDKDIFKKTYQDWKNYMRQSISQSIYKAQRAAKLIGMNDKDVLKLAKEATKHLQDSIKKNEVTR